MWGANADELLRVAARLEEQSRRIDAAERMLTNRLRSAPWEGPASDRYRSRWEGADRKQLRDASGFLRDAAVELRRNAAQQSEASASRGDGASANVHLLGTAGRLATIAAAVFDSASDAWTTGPLVWGQLPADIDRALPLLADTLDIVKGVDDLKTVLDGVEAAKQVIESVGFLGSSSAIFGGLSWGLGAGGVLSVLDIAVNWGQHGLYSEETQGAIVDGVGSGAATFAAGPLGAIAWKLGSGIGHLITDYTEIDESMAKQVRGSQYVFADMLYGEVPDQVLESKDFQHATPEQIAAEVARSQAEAARAEKLKDWAEKPWLAPVDAARELFSRVDSTKLSTL